MDINEVSSNDMSEFSRTNLDRYRRNYPLKIIFKTGEIIFGHVVAVEYSGDDFEIRLFKQIENLEDWKSNKIQKGTKGVSIAKQDIKDIYVYTEY